MSPRVLCICILPLCLIACMGKKESEKKQAHIPPTEVIAKPDFHRAAMLNIEMGQAYLAQGQITRAKQKFVHALELQPKLPEAHSAIAYFYESVGDIPEAEKHHADAIRYGTGKGRYYNNFGTFLCRQKRFKEADRAFNQALKDKHYIKTAEVLENAGLCALQAPENSKAYEYLRNAVKNDPNRGLAALELAHMEIKNNNPKSALYYLKLHKQANQPTARSLMLLVRAYQDLRKEDELASSLLQLKSMFPDSEEYKALLESSQ